MGDFSANVFDPSLTLSCTLFKLNNIVKELTCYKEPRKSSLYIFILIQFLTKPLSLSLSLFLSDFYKLVLTILWTSLEPCCLLKPLNAEFTKVLKTSNPIFIRCLFKKRLNELNTDDMLWISLKRYFWMFLKG